MGLANKVRNFAILEFHKKLLFAEAFFYLALARMLIMLPFPKVAPLLGTHMQETPLTMQEYDRALLTDIQEAVNRMANHTWWDSKCLVKAIAAMHMLSRRKQNSTLYLGTAKGEEGNLIAHAWLRSGNCYITGQESRRKFKVLSTFAKINPREINLATLSQEMKLMLWLLDSQRMAMVAGHSQVQPLLHGIDWQQFLALIKHHRLYPAVYRKITELAAVENCFPLWVTANLRREYEHNTLRMLQLCGEMNTVSSRLSAEGICTIFLKGPALAADLYGDLSLRTSRDLDMIIPIGELNRTEQLLVALGYVKDEYIQTVLGDWKWRHHHMTFSHPHKQIKLEVHWRLNPSPSRQPDFAELWKRSRVCTSTGLPIHLMGKEDLFLFLASHGARHGWSRLRWLADIDRLCGQQLDWAFLNKLLRRYQFTAIGGQALILSAALFRTRLTDEMRVIMRGDKPRKLAKLASFYFERKVNLHSMPVPEEVSEYHKRYLVHLMPLGQKLQFALSFLYPYPEDAETLPLPLKFHFLYFPLRPLLWIWRKSRMDMEGRA